MHELRPGNPDSGLQERPFPLKGHSLFVSSIGERGAQQAMRFMQILKYSHGSEELLEAAAAFHAHPQIVRPMQEAMHVSPGWFRKPDVVINDVSLAAKAFHKHSERHNDSGRAVFHFISYERGTARLTRDTLETFKREIPDVFHIGILVIPPSDPVSIAQLQREAEEYPLETVGIPLILVDETNYADRFIDVTAEDALLYGLAGLVADHRTLPHLNRHNYRQVLGTLSEESKIIGVAGAYGEHPRINSSSSNTDKLTELVREVTALCLDEKSRLTTLPRKLNPKLDVVVIQMSLDLLCQQWKKREFLESLDVRRSQRAKKEGIKIPDTAIYIYGDTHTPVRYVYSPEPVQAVHLYPTATSPGVDYILEILRRETPAPSPVPA